MSSVSLNGIRQISHPPSPHLQIQDIIPRQIEAKIDQGVFSLEKYNHWKALARLFDSIREHPHVVELEKDLEMAQHSLRIRLSHLSWQTLDELLPIFVHLAYLLSAEPSKVLTNECGKQLASWTNHEDFECLCEVFEQCFNEERLYECLFCAHLLEIINGNDYRAQLSLARSYYRVYRRNNLQTHCTLLADDELIAPHLEKAKIFAKQAAALKPEDPDILDVYAMICEDEGSTQEAIDTFRESIFLEPRHVPAWIGLLRIFQTIDHEPQNLKFSMQCCDILQELDRPNKKSFYEHNCALLRIENERKQGNLQEATSLLEKRLKAYPTSTYYRFLDLSLSVQMGTYSRNEQEFESRIAPFEKMAIDLCNTAQVRARWLAQKGDVKGALVHYQRALESDRRDAARNSPLTNKVSLLMEYCGLLCKTENEEHLLTAVPYLRALTKMAPKYSDAWLLKAQVENLLAYGAVNFIRRRDLSHSALDAYQKVIELREGGDFDRFCEMANLCLRIHECEQAKNYARLAFHERKEIEMPEYYDVKFIELLLSCDLVDEADETYHFSLEKKRTEASVATKMQILLAHKQIDFAIQVGKTFLKEKARSAVILTEIAHLFYVKGNPDEVLNFCQLAIQCRKSYVYAHYLKGLAYQSKMMYHMAIPIFENLLQTQLLNHMEIGGRLVECYHATHRILDALTLFKRLGPVVPYKKP